jgi:aminoglycoside/choline kinase family phosphotransferase
MESSGTSPKMDPRLFDAQDWLNDQFADVGMDFRPVTGDASNRRYFRVLVDGTTRILMDAEKDRSGCESFLDIDQRLRQAGLHAPEILATNLDGCFILMEDLGRDLYRELLIYEEPEELFNQAFDALAVMAQDVSVADLPVYDEDTLYDDLNLFTDLYLVRHRNYLLSHRHRLEWMAFCDAVVASNLEQPQTFVHKDFHSFNLLRTEENTPGIIDFQDALIGPITYDFASLIWDRYITWPRPQLEEWMEQFRVMVGPQIESQEWVKYCDLVGLQRNLRIIGRFAQLEYSEGKKGYLEMIPRFYGYVLDVLPRYPEFAPVADWIGSEECAP